MNKTVVFILSHNYSGSTWLSLLLGSHSQAFYAGELNKFYSKKDPRPCARCHERGMACPYFHDVRQFHPSEVFDALFARTGKRVLIDNSKRLKWCRRFFAHEGYRRKFVFLIKDPRALYYSLLIRNRTEEFAEWAGRNAEINDFLAERQPDSFLMIYNELAEHPDESLAGLCRWLGLVYEPAQKEYWRFEHHGPGENGATTAFLRQSRSSDQQFYSAHRQSAFVDLRWRAGLDDQTVRAIENDRHICRLLADLKLELTETGLRKQKELAHVSQHAARRQTG